MLLMVVAVRKRASLLQEDHLNWPNNQTILKTVAQIINPREITRIVHATD